MNPHDKTRLLLAKIPRSYPMSSMRNFLLVTLFSLVSPIVLATGINPDPGPPPPPPKPPGCGGPPQYNSFEWFAEVGDVGYQKQESLLGYAQTGVTTLGDPDAFEDVIGRVFTMQPLQKTPLMIGVRQVQFGPETFHPSCLSLTAESSAEVIMKPAINGKPEYIHNVVTDNRFTLIELLPLPQVGWKLSIWLRTSLTKVNGFYLAPAGPPMKTVIVKSPFGPTSAATGLHFEMTDRVGVSGFSAIGQETIQTLDSAGRPLTIDVKNYKGPIAAGNPHSREILTYTERGSGVWDYTFTRENWEASMDQSGAAGPLIRVARTHEKFVNGPGLGSNGGKPTKRRVSLTEDSFDATGQFVGSVTTTQSAVIDPTNRIVDGRFKSINRANGSWQFYEYLMSQSSPSAVQTKFESWNDLTLSQKAVAKRTVTTTTASESVVEEFVGNQLIAKSTKNLSSEGNLLIMKDSRWDGTGTAASSWHVRSIAYHAETAATNIKRRIAWIEYPNGTASAYAYSTVDGNNVVTERKGAGNRSGVTSGTETITTYNSGNYEIAKITRDITSSLTTERWDTDLTYNGGMDPAGRPIKRIFNADTSDFDIRQFACCGLDEARDRMGRRTNYFRGGLNRVYKTAVKATPNALAVNTFFNVEGLYISQSRSVGNSDALFTGSTSSQIGKLNTAEVWPSQKSISVADRPLSRTTTAYLPTGEVRTTVRPNDSTVIESFYLDGRIRSVSGSAVPPETFAYSVHNENGGGQVTTRTASGVITSTYTDLLGRVSKVVSGTSGTTSYLYHPANAAPGSRGQLQSVTDGDGVTVSYGYNSEGEQVSVTRSTPSATGLTAQVTTTVRDVVPDVILHGVSLGVSTRVTQSISSASGPAIVTSRSYIAINGLTSGTESFGQVTLLQKTRPVEIQGPNGAVDIATHTETQPDSTQLLKTFTNGLLTSSVKKSSTGVVITSTSFGYDEHLRVVSVTDGRTGTTTYGNFTESGVALSSTDPGNRVTTTEKNIMGQIVKTTLPDASTSHTAYHPDGQVKVTWGSQTYPTWTVYDEQGRKSQLHTWKVAPTLDPSSVPPTPPAGSEVTQWIYGSATGRLTRKQYADGKGTDYSYTAAGRLRTRTWQRGVTTTYSYTQGFLTSTDYSDATPDVSITYDALGRQASVTQANQSKISYTYDPANLRLDLETTQYDLDRNGSYEFTRVLDRSRDALQRDTGFQLKDGTTLENQVTYTYGPTDGRVASISGGGFQPPSPANTFSYSYLPSSNLLSKVTGPAHDVINTYEPTRDILDTKTNQLASTVISRYDYAVNEIGQRTGLTTSGTAFPNLPSWFWGYDSLGQVTSADSSVTSNDRSYQYDTIGNRKKSSDSLTLPASDNYTANALNQYSSIQEGGTSVSPMYDDDGNATAYPLPVAPGTNSTLVWDAENRLISSTVGSSITDYLYDAKSRRIAISRSGLQPLSSPGQTTLFLYDEWNCIAEYQIHNSSFSLHTSRLWGLDLSGSFQGAGGVGGLLCESNISDPQSPIYYPTYDGNGNVSEYLTSNGSIAAHYEYDPFGRTTVATGAQASDFTYRFSTKPLDSQTGLYYYGYRYYDPLTARWLSRDPIVEKGGTNLYGFVKNNSISNFDLLGKIAAQNNCPKGKIKDPEETQECLDEFNEQLEVATKNYLLETLQIAGEATILAAGCVEFFPNAAAIASCILAVDTAAAGFLKLANTRYENTVAGLKKTFQRCIDDVPCICPVCNSSTCKMD